MKIYIIIFCLFLSIPAYSQISGHANDTINVDSTLNYRQRDNHSASGSSISIIKPSDLGPCQYQDKLISFSKDYKTYLDAHNHDDKDVLYILNGKLIDGKHNEIINTICGIPDTKIKYVGFFDKWSKALNNTVPLMIITTKKN